MPDEPLRNRLTPPPLFQTNQGGAEPDCQRQTRHHQLLNEITHIALESQNVQEMLNRLAARLGEVFSASGCYILLWDADKENLKPVAAYGQAAEAFLASSLKASALAPCLRVIDQGRVVMNPPGSAPANGLAAASTGELSFLILPLAAGQQRIGLVCIGCQPTQTNPDGAGLPNEEETLWDEIAAQISLASLKTILLEQEQLRRQEAEDLQISASLLSSTLNVNQVLSTILAALARIAGFDLALIDLVEGEHIQMAAGPASGSHPEAAAYPSEQAAKMAEAFSPLLKGALDPVILSDLHQQPGFYPGQSEPDLAALRGWMGVPLIAFGSPIGFLALGSQQVNAFHKVDARRVSAFARQAAVTIENARLFEQVRNGRERLQILSKKLVEVQEAERRRLAHELHDEIGQALTGLQFTLEMGKRLNGEALRQTLDEAQEQISGLMNQVREMSIMLRPSILDDLGLLPALRWLFNRYQPQTGIQVHFTHQGIDRRFSPDIETTAFRVTQEALTNIARYAGVREVKVSAVLDAGSTLSIQIQDQGRGFDPRLLEDSERSFGIAGMYERTNLAGGIFEIQTNPGRGTCITAIFPIDHPVERRKNER